MKWITLVFASLLSANFFEFASAEENREFKPYPVKDAVFWEQFLTNKFDKWTVSKAKKQEGTGKSVLSYVGEWSIEYPRVQPGFLHDYGLVVKTPAALHAISAKFDKPVKSDNDEFVVQYEVKLQKGLECGGAYLKLLSETETLHAEEFSDRTPYQIMFGPDRCGGTNKVHLILQRKNPISGEYHEKQLADPPRMVAVKATTLYTLILRSDQTYEIRINGETVSHGNLLEEGVLRPFLNPPEEILDENDEKPDDWEEEEFIPDPNQLTKPDDWDESAPRLIPDPDVKKPKGWLDDEPEYIEDLSEEQPEDWDEEDDGEWTPPMIPNPACEAVGCGKWEAPMIRNPEYKGKWKQPTIKNPNYKGVWTPRTIKNPEYFVDSTPANFDPIGAIGFEIWTMQEGILFDNIYVGNSVATAEKIGNATFVPKYELEQEDDEEKPSFNEEEIDEELEFSEEAEPDYVPETKYLLPKEFLSNPVKFLSTRFQTFFFSVQQDPIATVKETPIIASIVVATFVIFCSSLLSFLSDNSAPTKPSKKEAEKKKKADASKSKKDDDKTKDDDEEEEEEEEDDDDEKEEKETEKLKKKSKKAKETLISSEKSSEKKDSAKQRKSSSK